MLAAIDRSQDLPRAGDRGAGPPSGPRGSPRARAAACLLAVLVLAITTAAAARLAGSTLGRPFAELLFDPYGSFSAVQLPSWRDAPELRFPDRLLAFGEDPVPRDPRAPNRFVLAHIHAALAARRAQGSETVVLSLSRDGAPITVEREIGTIGADEIAFFFGLYSMVGWAILASGIAVFLVAERRAAARAYGLWSVGAALFFCSFYDYHSTAALVPLFNAGALCTQIGILWLAWAFPQPPRDPLGLTRKALSALSVLGGAVALGLSISPLLGWDFLPVRALVSKTSPLCLLALVLSLLARLRAASGEARAQLRAAVHGLVTVPLLLGTAFLLVFVVGSSAVHLLLPLLAPAAPFAVAYSIVRHDTLHTNAVLHRRLVLLPVGFLGSAAGLVLWLVLRAAGREGAVDWLVPAFSGVLAAALLVIALRRFFVRVFFPAAERYRPTIEQLGERLSALHDEEAIRAELSRLVKQWLPVELVLVLPGEAVETDGRLSANDRAALRLGHALRTESRAFVPLRFQGEVCGVFELGKKSGGALFTSEDMGLLDTMAALGAVALRHASALREIERLRIAQVKASREERTRVVDTLSAELAHELGHPLRYFKDLFDERPAGEALTDEELEFARLQVERMDRMRATLETMEIPPPRKDPVVLAKPVEHALMLLREPLQSSQIAPSIDIAAGLSVRAEHDPLVQVFANLLRNAAQAAGPGGRIGVRACRADTSLLVDVWDDGPGVAEELQDTLFRVWGVTTRREGKGLGLMVVNRVLSHLHWHVDFLREDHRTIFRITIPSADVVSS